jgi:formylglycine-generating enzyme required for sulfatase activity
MPCWINSWQWRKKAKVEYISSTFIDLIEHRKAVKEALERARVVIECMEKYAASDERPKDKCLKDVAECDYYVLILAWRYGFQPPNDNPDQRSITQMEYEEAVRLGKKPLVFLLDPEFDWKPNFLDPNSSSPDSAIAKFRNHVMLEHTYQTFTTPESLSSAVLSAIMAAVPEDTSNNAAVRDLYLAWLRQTCESFELLGLNLKETQNVRLGQVYVPAVTEPKDEPAKQRNPEALREESHALLLHRLGEESLYLPGAPGAGKTTFCRWLALVVATGSVPGHKIAVAEEFEEKLPGELRGRFPLLCHLREWAGHEDSLRGNGTWTRAELEQSLAAWMAKTQPGGLTWSAFQEELQAGRALLILDGVDEVPESLLQGHLPRRNLVTGLADALPAWLKLGNRVLLTSRPYGLCNDDRRRVNLPVTELAELPEPLQDAFVRRWYAAADPLNAKAKASGLLVHLQEREDLAELRRNPMLLTALCVIYDQGQRLPQGLYKLYDAVVGQVLYKRYLTENERDRARYRLEAVALGMHCGDGGTPRDTPSAEVDSDEIDRHLAEFSQSNIVSEGGAADAASRRENLLSNSGLLLPRADGRAGFYHLSFQEFLAAVRLKRMGKTVAELLGSYASAPAWHRTLRFLFCAIADKDSPDTAIEKFKPLVENLEPVLLEQDPNPALLFAGCLEDAHERGWNVELFALPLRQACDHALLHLNPPERANLWKALGKLEWDDRQGVGLMSNRLGLEDRVGFDRLPDIDWVNVPKGPFLYGEEKQKKNLPAFKIARYPITNSQFKCFIDDGGYADERWWEGLAEHREQKQGSWNGPNPPCETVTWYEVVAYSRWLTAKLQAYGLIPEGMVVRLPTEQEWEKAARGNDGREFPWGEEYLSGRANVDEHWGNVGVFRIGHTTAVGIYPGDVSPYGVLDMAGNVREWCLNEYYQPERRGTEGDARRAARGGSWRRYQDYARAAARDDLPPECSTSRLGFRLVCVAPS